jgi:membrane-associated protein
MSELLDILLHINDHLDAWLQLYGTSLYLILFLIIFVETGLVIMPFLPGDSLLFVLYVRVCLMTPTLRYLYSL